MKLSAHAIKELIAGVWTNPQSGNTWFFSIPTNETNSHAMLKQSKLGTVVSFPYSIVHNDGTTLMDLGGAIYEIIELSKNKLTLKIDEETTVTLCKEQE